MAVGAEDPNAERRAFWSSAPGRKWVANQAALDTLFKEVTTGLLALADLKPGERVIDLGCGTGDLSVAAARAVGEAGSVLGVDIAAPMVEYARHRASAMPQATFLVSDAQEHEFPSDGADIAVSRFGVMFFADPVTAFANIARGIRPGGRLALAAWAPADENPWSHLTRDAAIARLGKPQATDPHAPGQFAFADPGRTCGLLDQAGLSAAEARVTDLHLHVPGPLEDAVMLSTTIGPVSRIMQQFDGTDDDLAAIRAKVTEDLAAYHGADGLRIPARVIFYTASVP